MAKGVYRQMNVRQSLNNSKGRECREAEMIGVSCQSQLWQVELQGSITVEIKRQ